VALASATPGHGKGGHADVCLPSLNPQSGPSYSFSVYLSDYSESLKLRVYGKAMTAIVEVEIPGNWQPGWNKVSITPPDLSNGLYYVLVRAADDSRFLHKPALLMVIR